MSKSVSFARPAQKGQPDADAWIGGAGAESIAPSPKTAQLPVPMKRLTLDIPEDLHRRVKSGCAVRGEKIADVVRRYLASEFPET